jgi:hypothetical protein
LLLSCRLFRGLDLGDSNLVGELPDVWSALPALTCVLSTRGLTLHNTAVLEAPSLCLLQVVREPP